jgi:hypothetical protein
MSASMWQPSWMLPEVIQVLSGTSHIDHRQIVAATLKPPPKRLGVTHALVVSAAGPPASDLGRHGRSGVAGVRRSAVAGRDVQRVRHHLRRTPYRGQKLTTKQTSSYTENLTDPRGRG